MGVTIKDVARTANVSVATVSRVLNKKTNVSEDAVNAVNAAVEELGYNPNYLGRDLRKSETRRILAIVSSMGHSFYSDVLIGMERAARANDYDVLVVTNNDDPVHEMHLLGMLFSRSVDGAVLLAPKLDAKVLSGLAENYNIAVCLERLDNCKALTVTIDNVRAGRDAVSYLIRKGHKRIGLISTEIRSQSSVDREQGYINALKENGIPVESEYIYYGGYDHESGVKGSAYFLGLKFPPTAVFCISDTVAIGAMSAAMACGVKVGKEMMFFGFDNITFSRVFKPHLSTVEQPCILQGKTVVEKLVRNIKTEDPLERDNGLYMLPHSLILRESTNDSR
ncbi:MAG: LacI family DNA-binding transcriptional regulator [Oscillospiraceae bacterium]|nr:LacI family DNA-binding transcriptional regulator [Oscillospiraceae bacterium]